MRSGLKTNRFKPLHEPGSENPCRISAFARRELVTLVTVLSVLGCLGWLELSKARTRAKAICCNCNLKQIGLAFRTWALDHHKTNPMDVPTALGGTREYLASGEVFRHFLVMSNELSTPRILVCPKDRRVAVSDWGTLANNNLSYFVGFVTNAENPQMFLSGDRDLTNGALLSDRVLALTTNSLAGWRGNIHREFGNIALADGSVQALSTARLRDALRWTGVATNQLALP